jgi:transmembrane sensor
MELHKFKKKLSRYLKGRSNETENALIEAWYKSYDANERELAEDESAEIGQAIHARINAVIKKPSLFRLPVFRIAASLVAIGSIALLIWHLYTKPKTEEIAYYIIKTGTNGIKQVTLPDSSTIWLNAASSIRIPLSFTGHFRVVDLLEGEAFFDIKRDPQHPFITKVANLKVQVWGTSFNIRDYKGLGSVSVTVATGKVGVTLKKRTLAMLTPGQQLCYNVKTTKFQQQLVSADQAQSWKSGYTYLTQANFEELALIMKNIFGLSLKAGNSRVNAYRFSLRLQHNLPADQVLKVISQIHNTQYRREGDNIILY